MNRPAWEVFRTAWEVNRSASEVLRTAWEVNRSVGKCLWTAWKWNKTSWEVIKDKMVSRRFEPMSG